MSLFMGGESTPEPGHIVKCRHAYRLKGQRLKDEFYRAGPMQRLLLRYTQALLTQMAQTAVCNRHHSLDQQLCRWLLLSLDRLPSNELVMTQELIANMLGVRREGVTEAAGNLQRAGLISYQRGRITVLDRPRLEARCCECYAVVRKEFERFAPGDGALSRASVTVAVVPLEAHTPAATLLCALPSRQASAFHPCCGPRAIRPANPFAPVRIRHRHRRSSPCGCRFHPRIGRRHVPVANAATNRLIEGLPRDRRRLLANCEPDETDVCGGSGRTRRCAFAMFAFPQRATSPRHADRGLPGLEVGLVGNEGMLGTPPPRGGCQPLSAPVQRRSRNSDGGGAVSPRTELSPAPQRVLKRHPCDDGQLAQSAA
ncbi:Crp/Fnr family transcriptional regulator [Propionivibrio sp.]|uniref:Crp/Fnr family transcriptional regulator n=1 Tax=Propionivibrio sp. TaxID=2212460 RepID=UPI0025CD6E7C|nr:helix-turn-helix domain-containing protein [Propionivibrio sp.]